MYLRITPDEAEKNVVVVFRRTGTSPHRCADEAAIVHRASPKRVYVTAGTKLRVKAVRWR